MLKKKLFLLSLVIGSTSSYAATSTTTTDDTQRVTLPHSTPGLEVSISALWLKPGASNLNYTILNKELPAQSPTWYERELRPSYDSALELGVRYVFSTLTDKDIHFSWTHLNSNTSDSVTTPNSQYFIGPDFQIGPDSIPIRHASGSVNFKYDVINLDLGQLINFGEHVEMRLFAGLSNAYLRENVTSTYSGNTTSPFAGPFSMMQNIMSNFTGIGPRFGVSGNYNMDSGFGFMAEGAVSALIGGLSTKTNYTSSGQELLDIYNQAVNYQKIQDQTVYQVIPGTDAKLGINYKYLIKHKALFTVTAGYQAAVYMNAISQYIPASLVQPLQSGGIFVGTMSHTLSNYSVQGPFLNFSLQF